MRFRVLKALLVLIAALLSLLLFFLNFVGLGFNNGGHGGGVSFFLFAWLPLLSFPIVVFALWKTRLASVCGFTQTLLYLVAAGEWPPDSSALLMAGVAAILFVSAFVDGAAQRVGAT
jgi:hypothetical protein